VWGNKCSSGARVLTVGDMCRYIDSDGSEYVGEWKDDKRDGRGKCTLPGGGMFDGVWSQDIRHGLGTFTYPNGDIFEGEWKKDVPDTSHGVMKYRTLKPSPDADSSSKSTANMSFLRAEIGMHATSSSGCGQLRYTWATAGAGIYSGELVGGSRHGQGTMEWPNGAK
jgi:hypothetical protein